MKKSYRCAARRRYVTIRIPRLAFDLILAEHGYCVDAPVESSRRRQAVEQQILCSLASVIRCLISGVLDDSSTFPGWTVDELLKYYSGIPTLSKDESMHFVEQYDPL